MQDVNKKVYALAVMIILTILLVGSPLATFGCRTFVPTKMNVPCKTSVLETAVQTNFIEHAQPIVPFLASLMLLFWFFPMHWQPKEHFLRPPSPPPRPSI